MDKINGEAPMDQKIVNLLEKGTNEIFPSKEYLRDRLLSFSKNKGEKPLKIYAGVDPTGPTLHIGHVVVFEKLRQFQELGHEVIMLIGDYTARIGDPDKTSVRVPLTEKQIKNNLKLYKKQAEKFLNFKGKNPAKIVFNSKWLSKLKLKDILDLCSLVTVDQMMKKDMFIKRAESGHPVYVHEFMYPIMQGYDSVHMKVDVEVGGNDQMFNMLVGRDFSKKILNKEKVAITMKLLEDNTGKKMGKTEGNMVSLIDSPKEMFGKVMSWTDGLIAIGYELCTRKNMDEVQQIKENLTNGSLHPKTAKLDLATEMVSLYFDKQTAEKERDSFEKTFGQKEIPEDIGEYITREGSLLSRIFLETGTVASMGEFRRLINDGAVTKLANNAESNETIKDPNAFVKEGGVYKVGKKRYLKITLE